MPTSLFDSNIEIDSWSSFHDLPIITDDTIYVAGGGDVDGGAVPLIAACDRQTGVVRAMSFTEVGSHAPEVCAFLPGAIDADHVVTAWAEQRGAIRARLLDRSMRTLAETVLSTDTTLSSFDSLGVRAARGEVVADAHGAFIVWSSGVIRDGGPERTDQRCWRVGRDLSVAWDVDVPVVAHSDELVVISTSFALYALDRDKASRWSASVETGEAVAASSVRRALLLLRHPATIPDGGPPLNTRAAVIDLESGRLITRDPIRRRCVSVHAGDAVWACLYERDTHTDRVSYVVSHLFDNDERHVIDQPATIIGDRVAIAGGDLVTFTPDHVHKHALHLSPGARGALAPGADFVVVRSGRRLIGATPT